MIKAKEKITVKEKAIAQSKRDLSKAEELNGKLIQDISDKNNKIADLKGHNAGMHD